MKTFLMPKMQFLFWLLAVISNLWVAFGTFIPIVTHTAYVMPFFPAQLVFMNILTFAVTALLYGILTAIIVFPFVCERDRNYVLASAVFMGFGTYWATSVLLALVSGSFK